MDRYKQVHSECQQDQAIVVSNPVLMGGEPLQHVDYCKYLELYVDDKLISL